MFACLEHTRRIVRRLTVTSFSLKGSSCRQEAYCTSALRRKSGRLFIKMSLMEKRTKFMHQYIAWTFIGDRGVQWTVRSRFRPHPCIAESEPSFLFEFTIKSARKLSVKHTHVTLHFALHMLNCLLYKKVRPIQHRTRSIQKQSPWTALAPDSPNPSFELHNCWKM